MDNESTVRRYLDAMFGGRGDFDTARSLLADQLEYRGPMLEADDADSLVRQLRTLAVQVGPMRARVLDVITQGDRVCALYEFEHPHPVLFSEWYRIANGRIAAITIVHDTRPYAGGST